MCGICGVVAPPGERPDERALAAQLSVQRHRGPDAEGCYARGRAAIAQNRLAIIDVRGGDPPITNEDGSIGVVLNGEIYNFRALRTALERDGHRFATGCDTEVLAHLAEHCEPAELARRLDGMFAFAVWDSRRERLVLGRDRLGKKPLYLHTARGQLVFASELKGVLAHPAVPRRLHAPAISGYLTCGYVPTPDTFFEGVRSLPPGHVLVLDGELRIERYWKAPVPRPRTASLTEDAAAVRAGLERAVERRLVADVPVGAFLSGGIDSSAVVALMSRRGDAPVRTFTIGFDDRDGYDERPFARLVAARYGTEHHEFVVAPDAIDLIERLVWHHDQPFGDSSAIPTYLLGELTAQHVTVALCGDGGDELFAGYERFAAGVAVERYLRLPAPLRTAARRGIGALPSRGRLGSAARFARAAELGMPAAYLEWLTVFDPPTRAHLKIDSWARDRIAAEWRDSAGAHPLERLLALNLSTYLLDDLLVKADRMSMAHALEVRSPFLDAELLELAAVIAPAHKARGLSLKRVLRAAVADLLPRTVIRRRKRGFGVPLDRWFRADLRSYASDRLGPGARIRNHLHGDAIDALLADHLSGARNAGGALWTLLTLEVFLRREGW